MSGGQQIVADTSALFALVDADDPHHADVVGFVKSRAVGFLYLVPDTVFSETMTLIKRRIGVHLAVQVGERIQRSPRFRLYRLDPEDDQETWRIFSRYTDKDWSYTDCSISAVACRYRIAEVFAFDRHMEQMAEVVRVPASSRL